MTVSLGARFPGTLGPPGCAVEGRPLRVHDAYLLPELALMPTGVRECTPSDRLNRGQDAGAHATARRIQDPQLRQAFVNRWLDAGRGEYASIPAFLMLAEELAQVGAPLNLVARALDAATDELRHALLCFGQVWLGQAADAAGMAVVPVMPALSGHPVLDRTSTLVRLAIESWEDGCIGEGAAAARASQASRHSEDLETRAIQSTIARDEQRHAELAWDVLAWCLEVGGKPACDAIAERLHMPTSAPENQDPSADRRMDAALLLRGLPSRAIVEDTWAATRKAAVQRVEGWV